MGTSEQLVNTKKERLKAVQDAVTTEGLRRRDDPNFSLLEFVKEMVAKYPNDATPLFYGLNAVARDWFDGYSSELLVVISTAMGLTNQSDHTEVITKMMPFLAIEGGDFAKRYLAMMGFTRAEIYQHMQAAAQANTKAMVAGELVF